MMKVLSVLLCAVGITLASADPQPPAVAAAAAAGAAPSVLARRLRGGTADGADEITTEVVEPEVKTTSASSGPDAAADRRRLLGEFFRKVAGNFKRGVANFANAVGAYNLAEHFHRKADKYCGYNQYCSY
ncbi:unnamed protein product [Vitrella brassicaformis CCMP3155]|uniref:RxLR effector protein n=1 Tax=Vitrella brassicaformis (strain CCMP3155) TaxID=1169540 RepID=A0A0G4EWK4_VITBC|nr:unnamed protein product [Vitrella brassicaformis CCMP3155]|eukprot:CEM03352.1 unnamed protein product [Vitrella brassicaformis CCMP3155]